MSDTPLTARAKIACGFQAVPQSFLEHAEKLERENAMLKAWKESALINEKELDAPATAKLLGVKLGESFYKTIANRVPQLVAENAALREDKEQLKRENASLWESKERLFYLSERWNPKNDFRNDEIGKWVIVGDYERMIAAIDAARKEAQP